MSNLFIVKNFPDFGEVQYRIASSREEVERAYALVYDEYLKWGFILPEYYKSPMRMTIYNILPESVTCIAMQNDKALATVSIMPDSPLGMPMDDVYKEDVDKIRQAQRGICEVGQLAIKTELFGFKFFSMFNFNKLDFIFTLFRLCFQYVLHCGKFDDICIVTNPKYMIFKFLPFEVIGELKYYGYDRMSVKKKPAVPKRLDVKDSARWLDEKPGLKKMLIGEEIPREIFEHRFKFTPQDLHYFAVEKSDILKNAEPWQKEFIRKSYGLSEEEFANLCKE